MFALTLLGASMAPAHSVNPPVSYTLGRVRWSVGSLLAEISTSIVAILREHCGRGPMTAKTYVLGDVIVVVMRGGAFTALEQTITDSGQPGRGRRDARGVPDRDGRATQGHDRTRHGPHGRCGFSPERTSIPASPSRCSSWTGHCRDSARSRSSSQSERSDQPASGGFAESI